MAASHGEKIRAELDAKNPALLVLDREFETQSVDPMALEPESGLAWYDTGRKDLNLVIGVTSVQRRRRWSRSEKERIVTAAMESGAVASEVARAAGIHTSQLFRWRQQLCERAQFPAAFTWSRLLPCHAGVRLVARPHAQQDSRHAHDFRLMPTLGDK